MRFIFVIFLCGRIDYFFGLIDSFVMCITFTCLFPETARGAPPLTARRLGHTWCALKKSQESGHSRATTRATPGRAGPPRQRGVGLGGRGRGVTWRRGRCGAVRGCCQCRGRRTSDPASVPAPSRRRHAAQVVVHTCSTNRYPPPPEMICTLEQRACRGRPRGTTAGQGAGDALGGAKTRGAADTYQMLKCFHAAASPLCPSGGGRRGGRHAAGARTPHLVVPRPGHTQLQGAGHVCKHAHSLCPRDGGGAPCHARPTL